MILFDVDPVIWCGSYFKTLSFGIILTLYSAVAVYNYAICEIYHSYNFVLLATNEILGPTAEHQKPSYGNFVNWSVYKL
jgi:hypothetical protein